jgi:carboxyl-terminal processing protease
MKIFEKRNYLFLGILFVTVFFVSGFLLGSKSNLGGPIILAQEKNQNNINLNSFWKVWNTLEEKYPNAKNITEEEKVYGAINGLVESMGDPYTVFFTPEEATSFEEDISGTFSGIGLEVGLTDEILTVIAPLKNTPAYKAGIKSGDRILKIDEISTVDMTVEKAVKLIRGPKGTNVVLTIQRADEKETRIITVTRDVINVPTLETEMLAGDIFVIKLHSFSATSANLFKQAIVEFSKTKSDKLVLDMRGNPGGYLESAVQMSSWFLPTGKPVLIEESGSNKKIVRSKGYDVFSNKLKMVVLLDQGSASASEILAGALRDHGKALIVGEQSFGKGSVQEVIEITENTLLKVTTAKWLTPNGLQISEKGITPDILVKKELGDKENKIDRQMDKAIEVLKNWSTYKK